MIAPRVVHHPIVSMPDNESGRCTEVPKQPYSTTLYDHRSPSTLPSCRFARTAPILPTNHYPPPYRPYHQPSPNVATPYHPTLPRVEPPTSVEQCGQNIGKNCQLGPVDVEDLALYFEPERSQTGCPAYHRPSINSNFRRVARSINNNPYPTRGEQFSSNSLAQLCGDDWYDQFCNTCPQQQYAFCTEERWLECPASDRCPLYTDDYPYGENPVLPPCVYEDLQNGYCRYGCIGEEDGQIVEDYL